MTAQSRRSYRVSSRRILIRVSQENPDGTGGSEQMVFANIMTQNADRVVRKICGLVLDRRELLDLLSRMQVYPPR